MSGPAFGQSNASSDTSDYNATDFIIKAAIAGMQTVSVVKVVAVHGGGVGPTGTVDVQVIINLMTGGGTAVPHGVIYGVPFNRAQGGNSAFICDPVVNDVGMAAFASRDITSVKNSRKVANPSSKRMFDWADAIYVSGMLNGTPTEYVQMTNGGGIKALSPTSINLQSPANKVTGPLEVTGATTFDVNITVNGAAVLNSTLNVTGLSVLTGGLTSPVGAITALSVSSISPIGGGSFPTPTFPVAVQYSIGGNGLTASPLGLVGDVASPGNSMVYGTNASGVRGWYAAATGGGTVTSVGLTVNATYIAIGGTASPITGAGTYTLDLSTAAKASLALAATALQPNGINGTVTSANLTIVNGQITAAASGTGGSALNNLTPDLHPATPTGIGLGPNDEFETGATIDTAGTRYSGATAWTSFNNTGYTTAISGDGSLILTNATNTTALCGGYTQPITGATWEYTAKISLRGATSGGGLFLGTASGAAGKVICHLVTGNGGAGNVIQYNSTPTTFVTNLFSGGTYPQAQGTFPWVYMKIGFDGTNLNFSTSLTGAVGSFVKLYSETPASHLGTATLIGLTQGTPDTFSTICDWFRKTL